MSISSKIHSSSLAYLIICALGVAAFWLVGIQPNIDAMDELEQQASELGVEVQTQELLFPVYSRLIKEVQQKVPMLSIPALVPLKRGELADIDQIFKSLAENHEVRFQSAVPDASNYLEDSNSLTLNVAFNGDFFNFQKLLVEVCQLPFLISIDQVSLRTADEGKNLLLKLQLKQE